MEDMTVLVLEIPLPNGAFIDIVQCSKHPIEFDIREACRYEKYVDDE